MSHPDALPDPASVLWIAAHPDDEVVVAPLLARWCIERQARCGFLILTRGEAGECLLPGGCAPDVRTVRSSEAGAAAALFGADAILLRLPDGGGAAEPRWDDPAGDAGDAVTTVARYIEAYRPELILTFDARHGTTCHPDHREVGRLVLEAAARLSFEPEVYLLETRVGFSAPPLRIDFDPAIARSIRYDANQFLPAFGAFAWDAVTEDMRRHASQFDSDWFLAIADVPAASRAVYLAPATEALRQPAAQCP